MIKTLLAAIPLCVMNFSDSGLILGSLVILTGIVCWQDEFIRNLMMGCCIVGGFWLMASM